MKLKYRWISSLEKVFADEMIKADEIKKSSALPGEFFSLQLALFSEAEIYTDNEISCGEQLVLEFRTNSELPVELREVALVPVDVPANFLSGNLLRNQPGLYPDLLKPLKNNQLRLPGGQWRCLWVTLKVPEDCPAGIYPLEISMDNIGTNRLRECNAETVGAKFELEVLPGKLAAQKLLRYEWFHVDCLYSFYQVPCWSEKHWQIIENFIRNGAAHGLNVLFTPLWTPPLDTVKGGERPTVQLLKIHKNGTKYEFDFSRLERYLNLGLKYGMSRFGMSHAFTQWGAEATPKIMVEIDGEEKALFGWHVSANAPEYRDFLSQLMKKLLPFLRSLNLSGKVFFSVSDEPQERNLASYKYASELLSGLLEEFPCYDALSSFEFYKQGLIKHPVPGNDHIENFVGKVDELNTYYCVGQEIKVPNRFMAMPSLRNRIMGVMFYIYRIKLFLQWGFNFYYSQYSLELVNPFADTCSGKWVPAGDPFIVYPGADGEVYDSLRHEVFFDAIQDLRAFESLEEKIGRDGVLNLIHENLNYKISMKEYPCSSAWLLELRNKVNRSLAER